MSWLQDRLGLPSGDSGSFAGNVMAPFASPINYVANMAGAGSQDPGSDFMKELGAWFNPIGKHNQTQFPQQRPATINQSYQAPDLSRISPYDPSYAPDATGIDVNKKWLNTQYGTYGYNELGHKGNEYWSVAGMDPSKLPSNIDNMNFSQARDIYKDYFQNLSNYYTGGGMYDNLVKSDLGKNDNYKNFLPEYDNARSMAQSAYMDLLGKFRNRGDFGADLIGKGGFGASFGPAFGKDMSGGYSSNPYAGGSMESSYEPSAINKNGPPAGAAY